MWNLKDRNKVIGVQDKVNSFKRHIQAMYQIKPKIAIQQPWQPSFSLSKFQNKYHRMHTLQLKRQNSTLMTHLSQITNDEKFNTFLEISKTIPSNKQTFKSFKSRERRKENRSIQKQNMKILTKIKSINSQYSKQGLDKNWKQTIKYKRNISRKDSNPDFYLLAKRSFLAESNCTIKNLSSYTDSQKKLRPKTAFPR